MDFKSRDRELYYQVKEALASGEEKKFLREKLGYQVLINPYMIKVESCLQLQKTGWEFLSFAIPSSMYFLPGSYVS